MKSIKLIKYGSNEVIEMVDAANLIIQKDKLLVQVKAAGVNPIDWKIRNGYMAKFMPPLPFTLGGDFAGIVREIGESVTGYKKGDEVYGQANELSDGSGSFAQMALTKPENISVKPKNIGFNEAGALPLAGVSALQALTEHINLIKGQKILIHGGAGGIGSIAIQIAKNIGAVVATTVSLKDIDYVKKLGAYIVIDYKSQKFEDILSGYDAVFDTVAGESYNRSFPVLKNGGIIVSMLEAPNIELMDKYKVKAIAQQTRITTERLEKLAKLVESKVVAIHIDRTFLLSQTAEALKYQEENHPTGKVVINIE
jgi:NADPH:quinone reductase-like Zn-dependent oxidoreductase